MTTSVSLSPGHPRTQSKCHTGSCGQQQSRGSGLSSPPHFLPILVPSTGLSRVNPDMYLWNEKRQERRNVTLGSWPFKFQYAQNHLELLPKSRIRGTRRDSHSVQLGWSPGMVLFTASWVQMFLRPGCGREGSHSAGRQTPQSIRGPSPAEQRRREAHAGAGFLHDFFNLRSKASASQGQGASPGDLREHR